MKRSRRVRKCNYVKAMPHITFYHNGSSIEIRRNAITINGKVEDAAWAMAEELLKRGKTEATTHWEYPWQSSAMVPVIQANLREGMYTLELLKTSAIDSETWAIFKKDVEKICNKLTAFM